MTCPNCHESHHAPGALFCHICGQALGLPAPQTEISSTHNLEWADYFSEGLAMVVTGGKTGFLDRKGNFIIPPTFNQEGSYIFGHDSQMGFSEGLAAVSNGQYPYRQYGCIDPSGAWVIPPKYTCIWHFSEGLAPFLQKDKWGYLDKAGHIVIPPIYQQAGFFSDGLAVVQTAYDKYAFIDRTGQTVIKKSSNLFHKVGFNHACAFHDGLARVECNGRKGFINRAGSFSPVRYAELEDFSEGMAGFKISKPGKDARCGFLNTNLSIAIEPKFDSVSPFHEGLAVVRTNGRSGYVNTSGDLVIPCQFDSAAPFSEGMAAVTIGNKIGFVNASGVLVIVPTFESARRFSEGIAAVKENGKWHYIDKTGKRVF